MKSVTGLLQIKFRIYNFWVFFSKIFFPCDKHNVWLHWTKRKIWGKFKEQNKTTDNSTI